VEFQLTYVKKHHFDSSRNLFGDEWLCDLDCPESALLWIPNDKRAAVRVIEVCFKRGGSVDVWQEAPF
jgi:hypothetical protein